MVYLFAGASRRGDIREHLPSLADNQFHLELKELDLELHHSHDLSKTKLWDDLYSEIDQGKVDVLLWSPPCNTFSRARHNFKHGGPRPQRSAAWPLGFPWLRTQDQETAQTANFFVFQCLEAARRMHLQNKFFWGEHPEDLGKTKSGDTPASIWQLPVVRELAELTSAACWPIHQCIFGAPSSKPTRLMSNLPSCLQHGQQWPTFDENGFYSGPLGRCPHEFHEPLLGFNVQLQKWNTADSAAYPAAMCRDIALDVISALPLCMALQGVHATVEQPTAPSTVQPTATLISCPPPAGQQQQQGERVEEVRSSSSENQVTEQQETETFDMKTSACMGQPIVCRYEHCKREFTDGFGLCSPGRWLPGARNKLADAEAVNHALDVQRLLLDFLKEEVGDLRTEAFRLALGHHQCSPFDKDKLQDLRRKIAAVLRPGEEGPLLECPARQPFFLHLLAESLKKLGDPDWEILVQGEECFAKGVPVGMEQELPRTPRVFRKREKFRQLDITEFQPDMKNYSTAEMSSEQLEDHFRKDEQMGRMIPTTLAEAKQEFGEGAVLVAAMGAIQKPDNTIRPLHDGTHGINLNNKIRILDRLEVPGPEEVIELVAMAAESKESAFCLSADLPRHTGAYWSGRRTGADWPAEPALTLEHCGSTVWERLESQVLHTGGRVCLVVWGAGFLGFWTDAGKCNWHMWTMCTFCVWVRRSLQHYG